MRHLNDGTLRRIYDEPLALSADDQAHYDSCASCQARFRAIADGARSSAGLLTVPAFEPQPAAALASLQRRIKHTTDRPWYQRWFDRNSPRWRPLATPAIAVALAAVLISGVAVTGVATQWLRVFEPRQFVGVQVSPSDFAQATKLLDYGEVKWSPAAPTLKVIDAATAHTESGLPILTPSSLPNGINGPVSYGVVSQATGRLTFDSARLRASAAKAGVHVNAMPSSIDGSTLIVNAGPALVEAWGLSANNTEMQMPTLVIAQTRMPTVDSTGASRDQLENYLLSQPGVPPEFAAQIKAIKDPSTTLPIPIPTGYATTDNVQVHGVQALRIKSAFGAGIVWQENGVIYAVGGQLTPDQVLAIATSLP
ncbi:MAG TPA: hypothetical protein VFR68_03950 [Candidatus Dormibacteraeota bacterium]|nr:hypothetical protein [Candidatus Dormibacteraeota bacterium]